MMKKKGNFCSGSPWNFLLLFDANLGQRILKRAIFNFMLVLCIAGTSVHAEDISMDEKKIQAGLVYNFLKYTSWPAQALAGNNGNIKICLLGGDAFSGNLFPLEGR